MAGKYVDEFTRVDSVILGPQGEFIYNYTVNMESTEFESLAREALKDTLSARIRRSQVADFLKEGIPIVVKYSGSDGILITEVRMEPEIERP